MDHEKFIHDFERTYLNLTISTHDILVEFCDNYKKTYADVVNKKANLGEDFDIGDPAHVAIGAFIHKLDTIKNEAESLMAYKKDIEPLLKSLNEKS